MSITSARNGGPRLEFVLRKVDGKIKRPIHRYDPETKEIKDDEIEVSGGYILYTCHGDIKHLTDREVEFQGLKRPPRIINIEQISAENPSDPWNIWKNGIEPELRTAAMKRIEENLIAACRSEKGLVEVETIETTKPKKLEETA